jgi:nitroreductase
MEKHTPTEHPVHDLIRARWSPRAFSSRPVETQTLRSLFEAARWAPSSMNAQPWTFLYATRSAQDDAHARMASVLSESNRRWATQAPILVLALARMEREPSKPNGKAHYDTGQAVAQLSLQATALGLAVHQMGGFDADRAREVFSIPPEFEPLVVMAIGYPGESESLPEDLRERELAPRVRRSQNEFVFASEWGGPGV